jgi:hypothetical protein
MEDSTLSKIAASTSLVVLCLACTFARFGYVGRAQTFAADLRTTKAGEPTKESVGRVYVSHGNVRIETPDLTDGFFLVDATQSAVWFLRPKQRLFMDARRSSPLTQVFVRVDPPDACRQWQTMERIAGPGTAGDTWRCDALGPDDVDGHETLKYQVTTRGDRRSYRWIDPLRQFPIRLEEPDGTVVTLAPIVDAPQPAALFAVPAGYRKFDPLQLIERIKQSDVWVEPRK